jgi:uncharacterized small protein (DUF1192 family)
LFRRDYILVLSSLSPLGDLQEDTMSKDTSMSLPELEDRIAIIRDNIRQLTEQAAASSGAADEDRNADRIAQQTEEMEKLIKQRDALLKK